MRSCSSARSVEGSAVTLANDCSIANATTCSANSGLPSDCCTKRRAAPGGGDASASRPATSSSVCSGESGSSIASTPGPSGPAHDGRSSSSSGRASATSTIGPSANAARYSTRSSSHGSAQCRSSSAIDERPVGGDPLEQAPERPLDLLARPCAPARADRDRRRDRRSARRARRRRAARRGPRGCRSRRGRARPRRARRRSCSRRRRGSGRRRRTCPRERTSVNSRTRRDLPMPGGPSSVTTWGRRSRPRALERIREQRRARSRG